MGRIAGALACVLVALALCVVAAPAGADTTARASCSAGTGTLDATLDCDERSRARREPALSVRGAYAAGASLPVTGRAIPLLAAGIAVGVALLLRAGRSRLDDDD